MTEATWDDAAKNSSIDWHMSAALEDVPRGDDDLAEVTRLEGAVRAWLELDDIHRDAALLTPERPLQIDGAQIAQFSGSAITVLAERLPPPAQT